MGHKYSTTTFDIQLILDWHNAPINGLFILIIIKDHRLYILCIFEQNFNIFLVLYTVCICIRAEFNENSNVINIVIVCNFKKLTNKKK